MPRAPVVIKQYGEPVKARLPNGDVVERKERIVVPSHGASYPTIHYDNHFVYRQTSYIGSSLLCTCGSAAGTFGYDAYAKYMSYAGEFVLGCVHHLQYGKHADGST